MTEYPLVSIITPSFNSAPFIKETIESVHSQDYPNIEHIVIDGGSTDGTTRILESYPHLIWLSEADWGQSHALNKGFRRARGEIIGWLNADDTYQAGAVSTAVSHLMAHPETDLVHGDLQIVDENGEPLRITRGEPFRLETYFLRSYIKQPTVFIRCHVLQSLGGVDESLHYVMDRELWLRVGLAYKMEYLSGTVLANFRLCRGTKSHEQSPSFHIEWIRVLERTFENTNFHAVPQSMKHKAMQKARTDFFIANMIQASRQRDLGTMFSNLLKAVSLDWGVLGNPGTWLFLAEGITGLELRSSIKKNRSIHRIA